MQDSGVLSRQTYSSGWEIVPVAQARNNARTIMKTQPHKTWNFGFQIADCGFEKPTIRRFLSFTAVSATVLLVAASSARAQAPSFTNLTDQILTEALSWQSGQGPFLLQRKLNLSDPTWSDVMTTSGRTALIPKDNANAFFRLQNQATTNVWAFGALLNGASEVPVTGSAGQGIGLFCLAGSNLTYSISYSGLSGPATGAHIHAPAWTTNNASVIIPFSPPAAAQGRISGSAVLNTDQISNLVSGFCYANIHTGQNPGGEIRSQITPLHVPILLAGTNESPSVSTPALGGGYLTFLGSQMYYSVTFSNLVGQATAAHIHGPAMPGVSAGVIVPFSNIPAATSGTISGVVTISPANLIMILAGQTYMNIHSTVNGGGEIRGQIWPVQWNVAMSGSSEVPTNASPGTGTGQMVYTNGVFSYNFSFANLVSPATAAHIHAPAPPGQNGNVIIPFSPPASTSGSFSGSTPISSLNLYYLLNGLGYANIHSTTFGGGEIRGQVGANK